MCFTRDLSRLFWKDRTHPRRAIRIAPVQFACHGAKSVSSGACRRPRCMRWSPGRMTTHCGIDQAPPAVTMSLVLPANEQPVFEDDQTQQQDDETSGGNGGVVVMASAARTHFALQLRDGVVASSPDRERRVQPSQFDQLKSPPGITQESNATEPSPQVQLDVQVQKLKEALQVMRVEKDTEIAFLREQLARQRDSETCLLSEGRSVTGSVPCPRLVPWMHSITERGDVQIGRLGRHASIKSARAITDLQKEQQQTHGSRPGVALAERMAAAFLNPVLSLPYLHSIQFGADLVELSAHVGAMFEEESRCLSLTSPVYVFGDLHGNLSDLTFFEQHLWRFGLGLTAGSFLFLGDYVDRGTSSLECVAYLFAHKLLNPHKVFLLRGNHETRAVNGLEHYYGSGCFLSQCRARFGRDEGYIVWHQINHAFDRLPLAATIDDAVFCVHGGIPRALPTAPASEHRLASIRRLPTTAPMDVLDKKFYDSNPQLRMVSDMLWGDPVREEHESLMDPLTGFGQSVQRGGSAVSFGAKAISDFLGSHGFSRILRAHEAQLDGVAVAKSAQVITIFSTSKDHALGEDATCGCVLVDRDRIAAINRSAAGQQHAVRRRRSVTTLQPGAGYQQPTGASGSAASPVVMTPTRGAPSPLVGASARAALRDEDVRASDASLTTMGSAAAASPAATARTRASAYAATAASSPAPSAAAPRRSSGHGTEDESTDDEAPSDRRSSRSSHARRPRRTTGDDNNQAED